MGFHVTQEEQLLNLHSESSRRISLGFRSYSLSPFLCVHPLCRLDHPARLLAEALDAPDAVRVCAALKHLQTIQALERSDHPFPVLDVPDCPCWYEEPLRGLSLPAQESVLTSHSPCDAAAQKTSSIPGPLKKSPSKLTSSSHPAVYPPAFGLSPPSSFVLPSSALSFNACKARVEKGADRFSGCICSDLVCTATSMSRSKGDILALMARTDKAGEQTAKRGGRRSRQDEKQQVIFLALLFSFPRGLVAVHCLLKAT